MKHLFIAIGLIFLPLFAFSQHFYSVDTHKLNFRTGPSANYGTILSLKKGDLVELISIEDNGWWQVKYRGKKGYVSSIYLQTSLNLSELDNHRSRAYDQTGLLNSYSTAPNYSVPQSNTSKTYLNSGSSLWEGSTTKQTYKIGETEYYVNDYYSTTGQPKVKRNMTTRREFLESKGYEDVPDGYEVDHIIPLSEGGADEPWNMQLLTVAEHKRKTASEKSRQSNTSNSLSTPSINLNSHSYNTTLPSTNSSSNKVIHTGPRGGKYYINSNGNKTYVKKKN